MATRTPTRVPTRVGFPCFCPASGKEKAHKHKQNFPVTARVGGGGLPTGWPGVSRPGGQGSKVYVLCAEPKEHKHSRPCTRPGGSDTRPRGSVTGVTGQTVYVPNVYVPFPAPTARIPNERSMVRRLAAKSIQCTFALVTQPQRSPVTICSDRSETAPCNRTSISGSLCALACTTSSSRLPAKPQTLSSSCNLLSSCTKRLTEVCTEVLTEVWDFCPAQTCTSLSPLALNFGSMSAFTRRASTFPSPGNISEKNK